MNEQPSVDRRTVARMPFTVMAAYAVAVTACQDGTSDRERQPSVRDSLGVEIVETDGQQARAVSQVTVQNEPELQIGELDGDPAYLFSDLAGVLLLNDGRIVVLDRAALELRLCMTKR